MCTYSTPEVVGCDLDTAYLPEAFQQEKWSQELAAWRAVAGEHDRLMQGWRKAWVCTGLPGGLYRGPRLCQGAPLASSAFRAGLLLCCPGGFWAVTETSRIQVAEETERGLWVMHRLIALQGPGLPQPLDRAPGTHCFHESRLAAAVGLGKRVPWHSPGGT